MTKWQTFKNLLSWGEKRDLATNASGYSGSSFTSLPTLSGIQITEQTALSLSGVWQAVNIYANAIAMMPFSVYERQSSGGRRLATDHPVYDLVHNEPNDETSAFRFRQSVVSHTLTRGNSFCEIERNGRGIPVAFHLLDPRNVEIKRDDRGRVYYWLQREGRRIDAANVLHNAGLGYDGIRGYSPIQMNREVLGLAKATENYASSLYGNSALPGGAIEFSQHLSEEAMTRWRDSFNAVHQGSANSGKLMIIPAGAKWITTQFTPEDAQLLLSRNFSIAEIARIFNLPQHMLGNLDHATFSNIEELNIQFYQMSLLPIVESFEQEWNRKLFSKEERKIFYVEHNFNAFLRGNMSARSTFYREMFNIGILSQNEIRDFENLNPIGEEGDTHYVPLNMVASEQVDDGPTGTEAENVEDTQPVKPIDPTTDPTTTDTPIANTGLNGAQVDALVAIVTAVSGGQLPVPTAKALVAASFPYLTSSQIDDIFDGLATFEPDPVATAPDPFAPNEALDAVRAILTDTIGRMQRRELGAVRKALKRPEEFRPFTESFYGEHVVVLTEALAAPVKALSALTHRSIDPAVFAQQIVAESQDRLTGLVVCHTPDELPNVVEKVCTEWEAERTTNLVTILCEKLSHDATR